MSFSPASRHWLITMAVATALGTPTAALAQDQEFEEIVVTRKGKPVAVVVNYAEFERLKDTLEVLADPELMRQIARSKAFFSRGGRGLSFEDVFDEPIAPGPKGRRRRRG